LVSGGYSKKQADTLIDIVEEEVDSSQVVTRDYFENTLDKRMAELKVDVIKILMTFGLAQTALIVSLIKLL